MSTSRTKQVLLIQPFDETAETVFALVFAAGQAAGVEVIRIDPHTSDTKSVSHAMQEAVDRASLIVVDLTNSNPDVMYEFGMARAERKPIIVIANGVRSLPTSAIRTSLFLSYNLADPAGGFTSRLADWIPKLIAGPKSPAVKSLVEHKAKQHKVFVSYSHADREFLDRLLVHLRPLEREGKVEIWADTHLRAGDNWKKEIEQALSRATAAILLISADFMASDFITNNELPPLLRTAEERGTRIIPLIVKASRFARDNSLKHFQAANDPKLPLTLLPSGEQEAVFDSVAEEVERWMAAG